MDFGTGEGPKMGLNSLDQNMDFGTGEGPKMGLKYLAQNMDFGTGEVCTKYKNLNS